METAELIPEVMEERIKDLEKIVEATPQAIANAICATRFNGSWLDKYLFIERVEPRLMEAVKHAGLDFYEDGRVSARDTDKVWLNYLMPIAAYHKPFIQTVILISSFRLDPGIHIAAINHQLPPDMVNSFWYSLGGNMLQDWIIGEENPSELRLGVLGLLSLEEYSRDKTKKLSDLIGNIGKHTPTIEGNGFRETPYFQLAKDNINPIYGHKLLRALALYFPFVCKRLVPIHSPSQLR